jgi:hypothetical protein
MGFPSPAKLPNLAKQLKSRFDGHFMVFNLSEDKYDYEAFDNQVGLASHIHILPFVHSFSDLQVMEHFSPGHPAPPLLSLCNICASIDNWLSADASNVAVVHCREGQGRTTTVLACALAWMESAPDFESSGQALAFVCESRAQALEQARHQSSLAKLGADIGSALTEAKKLGGLEGNISVANQVAKCTVPSQRRYVQVPRH